MNSFGQLFRIHSFGESHGNAMGVVIDGCPAGLDFDYQLLEKNLKRRRPGQSEITTARNESDSFEILSGIYSGKTLGTPIAIIVKNSNANSSDYISESGQQKVFDRVGHADDLWKSKFHHSDFRGGGRASGRETLSRVLGGSVAQMLVASLSPESRVVSFVSAISDICLSSSDFDILENSSYQESLWEDNLTRMPSEGKNQLAQELLVKAKADGKSFGGVAQVKVLSPPKNLGQPVFNKLKANLTAAFMGVGAVTGVELGTGFESAKTEGTEFHQMNQQQIYGGIRGGISTGETIDFKVAFKPTSSVLDVAKKGRHDPCIVPRAVAVLEAMTYLVLADHMLLSRVDRV